MKKTLLSTLALIALGGVVTSCGKEQISFDPQMSEWGNLLKKTLSIHG